MKIQSLDSVRGKRIHMHFDKSNSSIKSFFYSLLIQEEREREKKKAAWFNSSSSVNRLGVMTTAKCLEAKWRLNELLLNVSSR